MAKFEIEEGVIGAILITVGDTDGDGKHGVSAQVFGDIPWDDEDAVPLVDLPELDLVDADDLPGQLSKMMGLAGSMLGSLLKLVRL